MILLTGFEPFGTYTENPSADVAKALDGRAVGASLVRSAVLPVDHSRAAARVAELVDEARPIDEDEAIPEEVQAAPARSQADDDR